MIAQLNNSIVKLLSQLENAITELTDEQFNLPVPLLGGATIGQHIRHIVECYLELLSGYQSGTIKYDERKRDLLLQTCRQTAIGKLREIGTSINLDNKALFLCSEQSVDEAGAIKLATNYDWELLYNLEHTVHTWRSLGWV